MASKPDTGPDEADKQNPGSEQTNPAAASTDAPAEGDEESAPRQPGSPEG